MRMRRLGEQRLQFWMGLSLVVAAATGSVAFVIYASDQNLASSLVQTLIAVGTAAVVTTAWLWTRQAQAPGAEPLPLEKAADELAKKLREQCDEYAAQQDPIYPPPIQLWWRWSERQVTSSMEEVVRGNFKPLLRMEEITVEDLQSGTIEDLLSVYGGLRSGRLLVLGKPGVGKSSTGFRLLHDALDHRASFTAAEDRARAPVPVLVTPRGWDPNTEPFAEWLAALLTRNYDLLQAPEYGKNAAMSLIKRGLLAVILDGFEEIPEAWRSVALDALNKATFRLVVFTSSEDLVTAIMMGEFHLLGAAALELLPINSLQAAKYLTSCQRDPLLPPWQHLIDHLREHTDSVLAQALNTPLMLTLVRDTYRRRDKVDELIDLECRLCSPKTIEDHLLDRVLITAYAKRPVQPALSYNVDQARQWLGQLARRMDKDNTGDLAWWTIPRWVPAWPRVLATVGVISVVSTFLIGCLAVLASYMNFFAAFRVAPQVALQVFAKTFGYAFMFGAGLLVTAPPRGKNFPRLGQLRWSKTDIFTILLLGAGAGVGVGVEVGVVSGPGSGFAIGLVSSFVVGLGFVLGGGPPQQLGWLRWRRNNTPVNHFIGLAIGLIAGLVTGLGYGLGYGLDYGRELGFKFGIVFGAIAGVGYMLVIVTGGRHFQQSSQLQRSGTDTSTTLLIGFVIATVSTVGYGIIYVLIVILAGRSPLQQSRLRWSTTTTPITLVTGLIYGVVSGVAYGLVYWLTYGHEFRPYLTYGLGFGLTIGLLLGLRQPPTEAPSPLTPQSVWHRERQFALIFGLLFGLVSGLTGGLVDGLVSGRGPGLVFGITGGLVFGLGSGLVSSATWTTVLASAQLQFGNKAPVPVLRFLDDAHQRGILRTSGPYYQFRHERLRSLLATEYRASPSVGTKPSCRSH